MQRNEIDTAKVYAYREGRYGLPFPVRVFDPMTRYIQVKGSYEVLTGPARTSGYRHGRTRGGYLLVSGGWGARDGDTAKALETVTLEQVLADDLPKGISVKLVNDLRWVWNETWADYKARNESEDKLRKQRQREKERSEQANRLIADALQDELVRYGWKFDWGNAQLSSGEHKLVLTMTPEQAERLTVALAGQRV